MVLTLASLDQEDSPEEENGNLIQYSCLGNPMDKGAWQATVPGVTESNTAEHDHCRRCKRLRFDSLVRKIP